jgi:hypothetical protein
MQDLFRSIVVVFFAAASLASPLSYAQPDHNSLIGTITEAPDSPKSVGSQVTFTGLVGQEPVMVWPDEYDTKLSKVFESPSLLILQRVGAVGSIETVYIEVKNKRFLVVAVGALGVPAGSPLKVSQYCGSFR